KFADAPLRPGIVHRLDKDTSGILVVTRTMQARGRLAAAFHDRQVYKCYIAIVQGTPREPSGEIRNHIGRHPSARTKMAIVDSGGKLAISHYRVVADNPQAASVAVEIATGRTH